jgi:hypothetical protein
MKKVVKIIANLEGFLYTITVPDNLMYIKVIPQ